MTTNTISPWEGELVWVDNPRSGKTKKGKDWKSVDFTIKYTDEQDQERFIAFNTFGEERVDKILSTQIGTKIRVTWRPEAREYNGKWYPKFDAYDIFIIEQPKQEDKTTTLPKQAPLFNEPKPTLMTDGEADLPF